jgi:putative chitinase
MTDHALAVSDLLTAAQLRAIIAAQPGLTVDAERWAKPLADAMATWGILSVPARAAFVAICGEETRGFHGADHGWRERLNYSAARMAVVWPRYARPGTHPPEPTDEAVALAARGERAIANTVYAHILGNGGPESGDGWAFRGGCPIQITGKANWMACAQAHEQPVDINDEELAAWADEASADPALACSCSAWFFAAYARLLRLADSGTEQDFMAAARKVGMPPDQHVVALWLALWRQGLAVLGGPCSAGGPRGARP